MLVGLGVSPGKGAPYRYLHARFGGTSLATPLLAGAQQVGWGIPIGFANPAVYQRYRAHAYHDVTDDPTGAVIAVADAERDPGSGTTTDSVITFGHDTSLHAASGYDDVTGVGTPTRRYLDSFGRSRPHHWPATVNRRSNDRSPRPHQALRADSGR